MREKNAPHRSSAPTPTSLSSSFLSPSWTRREARWKPRAATCRSRSEAAFVSASRFPVSISKAYLATRTGIRVLEESLSYRNCGAECGDVAGEWEASVVTPPLLAAGDYVLGVAIRSPYQRLLHQQVLTFRRWPPPDESRESVGRNRIVHPAVKWRVERPVLAHTASS
jgi:hypothetical protein